MAINRLYFCWGWATRPWCGAAQGTDTHITLPVSIYYQRGFATYTDTKATWANTPLAVVYISPTKIVVKGWNNTTQGYNAEACNFSYLVVGY